MSEFVDNHPFWKEMRNASLYKKQEDKMDKIGNLMNKKPADKEDIAKLEKLIVDGFDRINCLINLLAASINPPSGQYGTSVSDPIGTRHYSSAGGEK